MAERKGNYKHGMYGTPTYKSWSEMKRRCGARWWKDVSYCKKWETFDGFLDDMGIRPKGTTLDRINPTGNYEKSNCRWADKYIQANNKRNIPTYTIDGEKLTLAQIARKYGISRSNLANKIYIYKMSMADAIAYLTKEGVQNG